MKGTHLLFIVTQAHVAENGAPPDKFGVYYIKNCVVLTAGSMFQGYHTLVPGINLFFIETVWVPLITGLGLG